MNESKDLEEIRKRDEIRAKSDNLLEQYRMKLSDDLYIIRKKTLENRRQENTDELFDGSIADIEQKYKENEQEMVKKYDQETNARSFPEKLKIEFRTRIISSLEGIKMHLIKDLNHIKSSLTENTILDSINIEIISFITDILKNKEVENKTQVESLLNDKLAAQDELFEKKQAAIYLTENDLISKIQRTYRQCIQTMNRKIRDLAEINIKLNDFINGSRKIEFLKWEKSGMLNNLKKLPSKVYKPQDPFSPACLAHIHDEFIWMLDHQIRNLVTSHLIDYSHIKNSLILLENFVFSSDSTISKYENYINKVLMINDMILMMLNAIYIQISNFQKEKQQNDKEEYAKSKKEIIEKIESAFKTKKDSKEAGKYFGANFCKYLIDYTLKKEYLKIEELIKNEINKFFPKPESLVDTAYEQSFNSLNYQNVYKYVTDLKSFCLETFKTQSSSRIQTIIDKELNAIKENLKTFLQYITNCFPNGNLCSSHKCIDFICAKCKSEPKLDFIHQSDFFYNFKLETIDMDIKDSNLFHIGFIETLTSNMHDIEEHFQKIRHDSELFSIADKARKRFVDFYVGCEAECPGCGAKCQYHVRHSDNNHKTNKHLMKCFKGWTYLGTNVIVDKFCWDESYKFQVITSKKTYRDMEQYLTEEHKDWLNDVSSAYNEFGKPECQRDDELLNHITRVARCWMNTRRPVIKFFKNRTNKEILDKPDYENQWKNYEDETKMLNEDYTS